jgi:ferredoxin/flavodoxin---NADP+ reductase
VNDEKRLKIFRVSSNVEIAQNVFLLSFERNFDFVAGQYIGLTTDEGIDVRLYSLASGTDDPMADILYSVNQSGGLTPRLAGLKPGDKVYATPPKGKFRFHGGNSWWIATGTGIAPFRSMWRSGFRDIQKVIHGGRFTGSFYFHDEFEILTDNYIRCSSVQRADGLWPGRVTSWLSSLETIPHTTTFYLCGSAEMVVEARDILISKGASFEKIISEIYF